MTYTIVLTKKYKKRSRAFIRKHPELLSRYKTTILHLRSDPHHPSLRLHKLKGELSDFYSVSINMKYRILLDFIIRDDLIILIDIGSHQELY